MNATKIVRRKENKEYDRLGFNSIVVVFSLVCNRTTNIERRKDRNKIEEKKKT